MVTEILTMKDIIKSKKKVVKLQPTTLFLICLTLLLPQPPQENLSCLEAEQNLLLSKGVKSTPGHIKSCALCFSYQTDVTSNMIRHLKYHCPDRREGQPSSVVKRSIRQQQEVNISFHFQA